MSKLGIWVDYEQKIVCNELHRQELISFGDWVLDASDCRNTFSLTTYQGYHLWAMPCLRLMRKHPALARSLAVAVRWMAADIKYQKGINTQRHWRGWLVRRGIFWPANWLLGHCVSLLSQWFPHASRVALRKMTGN
ncbi:MAG TPA: hypothetical protein VEA17_14900 [Bordetella sp.]|nr:hypothetical protein [Bordetella sp.]